ncbi:glycosyltransferase family 2 protein [Brachybacterium sp. UMB0905]|uniref:glycosyltransferase family 2 protein n=1 Tax=Brachybacterium sp. UMB0905 TaxID=2069310 RepID=UPI000C7FA949|nr:hypothetical protein CJ197_14360 [Brachybacterium sp. UMB0905]
MPENPHAEPSVLFVVPSHNEGANISRTVQTLTSIARSRQKTTIAVVDDFSSDGSLDKLEQSGLLKLFRTSTQLGVSSARNIGASMADADVLIFCDAHIETDRETVDTLAEAAFRNRSSIVSPGIGDVANPEIIRYGCTWKPGPQLTRSWYRYGRRRHSGAIKELEVPFAPGGFMCINRELFEQAGGFDESYRNHGEEDIDFSLKVRRLGGLCIALDGTHVDHLFRPTLTFSHNRTDAIYNKLLLAYKNLDDQALYNLVESARGDAGVARELHNLERSALSDERAEQTQANIELTETLRKQFQVPTTLPDQPPSPGPTTY